jgi:SHS2 domain-containing protein
MPGYKFFDHTADVEFEAEGYTIEEVFLNSLYALFDTQANIKMLKKSNSKPYAVSIKEKSSDIEELLWNFLQSTLSKCEARNLFGYASNRLKIRQVGKNYLLQAKILAKKKCSECAKLEVKGIAKYSLKVEHKSNKFTSHVIVDV